MELRQRDRILAHVLITELLAYQFAMPVQWIETQKVVLSDTNVEQVVEYGPSPILASMAKKTLDQFREADTARGIKRRVLSISTDDDEIHYNNSLDRNEAPKESTAESKPTQSVNTNRPEPAIAPSSPLVSYRNVPSSAGGTQIPDVPISALEAIGSLVASTLKRREYELDVNQSIRTMSQGRSTIQNEIMGEMFEEFSSLPDDAENMPLRELAAAVQETYGGIPQKMLRSKINKMMSSVMPGAFSLSMAKSHLSNKWGLATGRQHAVFLRALIQQPTSRLLSIEEAETYFDKTAQEYIKVMGLLRPNAGEAATLSSGNAMLDARVLEQVRLEQTGLKKRLIAALSTESEDTVGVVKTNLEDPVGEARELLGLYDAELGEEFCHGIVPRFHPQQMRLYDSSWNWAHADLLRLYYSCLSSDSAERLILNEFPSLERSFSNRWTPRLLKALTYLQSKLQGRSDGHAVAARHILENIRSDEYADKFETALSQKPCRSNPSSFSSMEQVDAYIPGQTYSPVSLKIESTFDVMTITPPGSESSEESAVRVMRKSGSLWEPHERLTTFINRSLWEFSDQFQGKNILVTGAGPSSIGMAMLPELLQGGACIIVTTSRSMPDAGPTFQRLYAKHGGNGSRLLLLPCNQGSKQDIERLVSYIYDPIKGLGWDLDFVIPFAALSEQGRAIDQLDSRSELAHRIMLTNVLRLMGAIKSNKVRYHSHNRPAQVLLPLSPNVGILGQDGLYSESKLGLTAVMSKWLAEGWNEYLSVCGVQIGWTRGTGLMANNDELATEAAKLGITTYSTAQMASFILRLMSGPVVAACGQEILMADISGGMAHVDNLAEHLAASRRSIGEEEEIRRALVHEKALDNKAASDQRSGMPPAAQSPSSVAHLDLPFPKLPDYDKDLEPLNVSLNGMVDLESVVVIVGFAELGPWGNSRSRWEIELNGELSIQGCIELAWIMGLIKYDKTAAVWLDAASGAAIEDHSVKPRYEEQILENTGIRLINPSPLDHPVRDQRQVLQEFVLQHDWEQFTAPRENAIGFVKEHGSNVEIQPISGTDDEYSVRFRKGAVVRVPKATPYDRFVGGQIPTGWDPQVYGLPKDICDHVDRVTLFALVTAAEAFVSAGIVDTYELYQGMHESELANCVGSESGGGRSLQKMFVGRLLDRPIQNDILAETFINTTTAWLNMLLLSSSGPTRTPAGACATALESLNQGFDLIVNGSAKVCLVGGVDDLIQPASTEFGNMKATNNATIDLQRGRAPHEMSRPCSSSRCGFVESEGCGMQVITNAKVALDLGLPIHAIVAHVRTASDGVGRSVPAPGKGLLAGVREQAGKMPSALLDIRYRKRLLEGPWPKPTYPPLLIFDFRFSDFRFSGSITEAICHVWQF